MKQVKNLAYSSFCHILAVSAICQSPVDQLQAAHMQGDTAFTATCLMLYLVTK